MICLDMPFISLYVCRMPFEGGYFKIGSQNGSLVAIGRRKRGDKWQLQTTSAGYRGQLAESAFGRFLIGMLSNDMLHLQVA